MSTHNQRYSLVLSYRYDGDHHRHSLLDSIPSQVLAILNRLLHHEALHNYVYLIELMCMVFIIQLTGYSISFSNSFYNSSCCYSFYYQRRQTCIFKKSWKIRDQCSKFLNSSNGSQWRPTDTIILQNCIIIMQKDRLTVFEQC